MIVYNRHTHTFSEREHKTIDLTSFQPILHQLVERNPVEEMDGAICALKELLIFGNITPMVERFSVSHDAAKEIIEAINTGVDPLVALEHVFTA